MLFKRIPNWLTSVVDQGVIAILNLSLSIVFSRIGGLSVLGTYSLISITMISTLGIVRTLVGDPWMASSIVQKPTPELRTLFGFSAVLTAVPTLIVALVAGGGMLQWLLIGLIAPLMIIQDAGRYAMYKAQQTPRGLASDVLLLAGLAAGVGVSLLAGVASVTAVICAWLFGYLLSLIPLRSALVGPVQLHGVKTWWNDVCRALGMPLLFDSIAYFVSINVSMYLLAALASAAEVGGVRVINSLYSPIALVFTGLTLWLVPWLARSGLGSTIKLRRLSTLLLLTAAVVITAAIVALGPWLAPLLFGNEAQPTRLSLLLGGVSACANAVAATWLAATRVFGDYRTIPWIRASTALVILALLWLVPDLRTITGFLGLIAAQNLIIAGVAWRTQARAVETEQE